MLSLLDVFFLGEFLPFGLLLAFWNLPAPREDSHALRQRKCHLTLLKVMDLLLLRKDLNGSNGLLLEFHHRIDDKLDVLNQLSSDILRSLRVVCSSLDSVEVEEGQVAEI